MLDLSKHADLIERAMQLRPDLRLVVIDPLGQFAGDRDLNKYGDMYSMLGPLNELASRYAVGVLIIMHLNKAEQLSAKYRTIGSTAIIGASRCAWTVMRDPQDSENRRRLLLPTKHNNSEDDDTGLAFRLAAEDGSSIARVLWDSVPVQMTADEALALAAKRRQEHHEDTDESEVLEFLRDVLKAGPVLSKEIQRECRDYGISYKTCQRHKDKLGVIVKREGFGKDGRYMWSLPDST